MAEIPWKIDLQERRLLYIGSICAQWSHLEYQFAKTIWKLLDLGEETGKIVTGGLDIIPRARMAILLSSHLKAPRELTKALVTARKEIQDKLDLRRNRAVHGMQFLSDDKTKLMVEVHRGRGGREKQELTLDELEKLCADIFQTSDKVQTVIDRILWDKPPAPKATAKPSSSKQKSSKRRRK